MNKKFSRGRKARQALFRSLIRATVLNGKITTTKAKAKAIQTYLEKYITWAKKGNIAGRRKVLSKAGGDREAVDALFAKVGPAFKNRSGGYTKITYLPRRLGDKAEMARIEWSQEVEISDKRKVISKKQNGNKNIKKVD